MDADSDKQQALSDKVAVSEAHYLLMSSKPLFVAAIQSGGLANLTMSKLIRNNPNKNAQTNRKKPGNDSRITLGINSCCHLKSIKKTIILSILFVSISVAPALITMLSKAYADLCTEIVGYSCDAGTSFLPPKFGTVPNQVCKFAMSQFCNPVIDPDPLCPDMTSCDPSQPQSSGGGGFCSFYSDTSCGDPNQDPKCPTNTSCDPNQPQQDPNDHYRNSTG